MKNDHLLVIFFHARGVSESRTVSEANEGFDNQARSQMPGIENERRIYARRRYIPREVTSIDFYTKIF